jgi:iron(III) transport system ATP-binding protein
MNRGRIEQVGTPDQIYGRPATAFVADFVGKMNFLDGRLLAPGRAEVRGADLDFAEPVPLGQGAPVVVCLRPEDVVVRDLAAHSANRITTQVGVMEFIGNHFATTLHAVGTGLNFAADLSMNDVRDLGIASGATIEVVLPPDRLRVFPQPPAAG